MTRFSNLSFIVFSLHRKTKHINAINKNGRKTNLSKEINYVHFEKEDISDESINEFNASRVL